MCMHPAAPRLHLGCTSAAPRLHLGCTSALQAFALRHYFASVFKTGLAMLASLAVIN